MSAERREAPLAIDPETFRALAHRLVDRVADGLASVPGRRITPGESAAQVNAALGLGGRLPEQGQDAGALLDRAATLLFDHSLFNGHPKFFGYITASPAPIGILGDFLASAVNPNCGGSMLSPAATQIELEALRWIAQFLGYPDDCGGILVSGGNMANFIGFWTARAAMCERAGWDVRARGAAGRDGATAPRLVAYTSAETHTWIQKAADLSGLGTEAVRWIETDADLRMDLGALKRAIAQDRASGLTPFLVVGTAGSVSTGAIDPLPALADLCAAEQLWFHVDGAYGGFAAGLADAPADLKALARADSVAIDPHKWLYMPLEAGCALVRDRALQMRAFSYHPPYYLLDETTTNFVDFGMQNSRGFRALKVWLALQQVGAAGYRKMIGDDIALARRLAAVAAREPELEAGPGGLSIATFRYVPQDLRARSAEPAVAEYLNKLNEQIVDRSQKAGEAFVSPAQIRGRYLLRACIVNIHTQPADVDATPGILVRAGRAIDVELRAVELGGSGARVIEGTVLGRYRVRHAIGQGGMGRVYLADDPALGREVAIKVLPPEFAANDDRRSRLVSEARAASALNHPNIVTIYDLGETDGNLFVAMEVIEGQDLRDWAGSRARSVSEILALVRQATRALAVAHEAGLVHRDLKPENLMVRHDGLLKILDFGLARSATPHEDVTMERTMPGTILGTTPYMSPEQVLGKPLGPASDVFAMGTLLYELLTGRQPFTAETGVDTMHRILHDTPVPPSKLVPSLPAALDFVIAKALAKSPARRYRSAAEFDVDLEACEAGLAPATGPGPVMAIEGASAPAPRAARAIAVLPFKNIGGSPDLNYLGVGLADAVITRLSNSPDLIVRPTSSIAIYENQPIDARAVARELEVSALLDASFQRAGGRFRATARLVEAPGGQALWAGKVDLDFADIFEVQDQVAQGIATALTARLAPEASALPGAASGPAGGVRAFAPKTEAFELYLRAQEAMRAGTRAGLDRAIELCLRAVEIDPGYADAWAQLAFAYHGISDGGFDPDRAWYDKAEIAVQKALAIDPAHGPARFEVGALHLVNGRKLEGFDVLAACHRAAPNQQMIVHYLAYALRLSNLFDDAVRADLHAIELDPSAPWTYWSIQRMYLESGRVAEGLAWWERARAKFPLHPRTREYEILLLYWLDRHEEVVRETARLPEQQEVPFTVGFFRSLSLLRLGRESEAREFLPRIARSAWADMDYASYLAALYAQLGDIDDAFRHLERAVELGNDMLVQFENPRFFGPLFDDPRWTPFVASVRGRVAVYRQRMRWPLDEPAAATAP